MKKILVFCLLITLVISMSACGNKAEDKAEDKDKADTETIEVVKIDKNIDAVAEALGLSGKSETFYDMIGAEDGAEYNDGKVELYQYDPDSKDYKDIEAGKGVIDAVACNSGFILVVPDGYEPDDSIVEAFKNLSF